jgi:hypothetical protein
MPTILMRVKCAMMLVGLCILNRKDPKDRKEKKVTRIKYGIQRMIRQKR